MLIMKHALALIAVLCLVSTAGTAAAVVGGGDLTFKPENANPVTFSHDQHVTLKGLKCSACHNNGMFHMVKGSDQMDMSKFTKGQFCGHCHNGAQAFDVKDKTGCGRCHK